jgi:hypothetical protein
MLAADRPGSSTASRPRHPLAPSLPLLTKDEEAKVERIIYRFIDYDTGKLRGPDGVKALQDFKNLGPESIPYLIDGFNRAANYEHSCPASVIARKLVGFLSVSNDPELLDYARENIGSGVTAQRHQGVLKDLRLACMLRKSTLQRRALASGGQRGSVGQGRRSAALTDLFKRDGPALKKALQSEDATVRAAAVKAIAAQGLHYGQELIDRLGDESPEVRQAARRALARLAGGIDYGPEPGVSSQSRADAIRLWQSWWDRQNTK